MMKEVLAEDRFIFGGYPNLEQATKEGDFSLYSLEGGYTGGSRIRMREGDTAYGILLAWDNHGNVIFRGGFDYYKGIGMLGQTSGSFQRALEHKGQRIGRKMAVIGLKELQEFVERQHLELVTIRLKTQPGSSMAKIGEYLGMLDERDGLYVRYNVRYNFPEVERLMREQGITAL